MRKFPSGDPVRLAVPDQNGAVGEAILRVATQPIHVIPVMNKISALSPKP